MSTSKIKKLINDLKGWLGPFVLTFSGGEPTLRKDIWELISFANKKGIITVLSTNGSLITKKNVPFILNSGLKYMKLSLDSLNAENYRIIRGASFNKQLFKSLKVLQEYSPKLSISINTVITNRNVGELPTLAEFVKQNRFNSITFSPMVWLNRDIRKKLDFLWPDQYKLESSIDKVIKLKKSGYPVLNSFNHLNLIKKYYQNPNSISERCLSMSYFTIDPRGNVFVCSKKVGNAFEDSFKNIFSCKRSKKIFKELRRCRKSCSVITCCVNDSLVSKTMQFVYRYIW